MTISTGTPTPGSEALQDLAASDRAAPECRPDEAAGSGPSELAVQCAAQCWCTDETKHIEMDARLAMAFARSVDFWIEEAMRFHRNERFYHGIVEQTGRILGGRVYVQDDGGIVPDVLALRVPEVAAEMMARLQVGNAPASETPPAQPEKEGAQS